MQNYIKKNNMKGFINSDCTAEYIKDVKKKKKSLANNTEISDEFDKIVNDTKTAIENIAECVNNNDLLNNLLQKIRQEDTTFLVEMLGLTRRGNNGSYYRSYLALDGSNILDFRAADHYETKSVVKDKSNNKAQYLFQLVMMTTSPKEQASNAITQTGRIANINIITRTITSECTARELLFLLKSIKDYLTTPSSTYDNNVKEENQKKDMKKNRIKITENELKQIVAESINNILKESYNDPNVFSYSSNIKEKVREYLDSLERSYGDDLEDCGNKFLKDVFKNGWAFFNSLSSFIHDDGQQEIHKY